MSGALRYDIWEFLDKIAPTACVSGCNVTIDTDATLANDFKVATGTYYTDVLELNTISSILYSSTATHDGTNVTAYYHSASAWTSGAEAGINFSQWDNATQKTSTSANKWYTGWIYIEDGDTLIYVYPQTEHASEGAALDEAAQFPPHHEGIILPSAKFIFRHGESAFGARAYFIDIRPFFGYGNGATAQMIYQTVTGDSGTTTATASDDSVAIVGGGITTTAVTADTVTVTATEVDSVVGAISGIVKADGAGNISAAVADTDYQSIIENNALTTDKLSVFAATTSAELAGVISDEEGTGKVVLNDSPTFTTKIDTPQVAFPASQSASADANTLDDYEEGTWTPTLTFGGASVDMIYTTHAGFYTKIGRQVTITGVILLSAKGTSTGNVEVHGLPFSSKDVSGSESGVAFRVNNVTFADMLQGYIGKGKDYINFYEITEAGVGTPLDESDFADNSYMVFGATYFTD